LESGLRADTPENYTNNRYPLVRKPLMELPLGSIKAKGWLQEMLVRQKNGATGQMDKLYPLVMGERNGWLGGDGDQWERGPYWIDGLLPLAYILDDAQLESQSATLDRMGFKKSAGRRFLRSGQRLSRRGRHTTG